jgi:hypothetical protein
MEHATHAETEAASDVASPGHASRASSPAAVQVLLGRPRRLAAHLRRLMARLRRLLALRRTLLARPILQHPLRLFCLGRTPGLALEFRRNWSVMTVLLHTPVKLFLLSLLIMLKLLGLLPGEM